MNYRFKQDIIQYLVSISTNGVIIADEENRCVSPWIPLNMVITLEDYKTLPWYVIHKMKEGYKYSRLEGKLKENFINITLDSIKELIDQKTK